jgi:hypothetical protein
LRDAFIPYLKMQVRLDVAVIGIAGFSHQADDFSLP